MGLKHWHIKRRDAPCPGLRTRLKTGGAMSIGGAPVPDKHPSNRGAPQPYMAPLFSTMSPSRDRRFYPIKSCNFRKIKVTSKKKKKLLPNIFELTF